jgi:hypothetical protein
MRTNERERVGPFLLNRNFIRRASVGRHGVLCMRMRVRESMCVCRERSGEFNLTSHPSCAQELANNLALCANMTCSVITHQLVIYDARASVHIHTLIIPNCSLGARAVCNTYLILA